MASNVEVTTLALKHSLLATLILCNMLISTFVAAHSGGFSVDLIHRDSSDSPFYDAKETPSQRIENALKRSIARGHRFSYALHTNHSSSHKSVSDPKAGIIANNGEYLMNISLGTPPFSIVAIADTGSDIIWTQCKPCVGCYKQDAPLFDPKSSSTYKTVSCSSNACNSLQSEGSYCSSNGNVCQYQVSYGDQSHTKGDVAAETLTLVPTDFLSQLSGAVESQVTGGTKTSDPQGLLSLCYVVNSGLKVPPITAHFQGADVVLESYNTFIDMSDTVTCLAFYGNDELSIYGNIAQQNFLIGYDLQKQSLSFKPTDCTKN
ncbi:Aspartic proteinase CDR1 [Linum grandiflorum]